MSNVFPLNTEGFVHMLTKFYRRCLNAFSLIEIEIDTILWYVKRTKNEGFFYLIGVSIFLRFHMIAIDWLSYFRLYNLITRLLWEQIIELSLLHVALDLCVLTSIKCSLFTVWTQYFLRAWMCICTLT